VLSSSLSGLGGSILGTAPDGSTIGSALDRLVLGSALDGSEPGSSSSGLGGSISSSALDCSMLSGLGGPTLGSALDSSMLSPAIDGLGGSTLGSALGGIDRLAINGLGAMRTEAACVQDYSESEDIVFPSGEAPKRRYEFKSKMRSTDGSAFKCLQLGKALDDYDSLVLNGIGSRSAQRLTAPRSSRRSVASAAQCSARRPKARCWAQC